MGGGNDPVGGRDARRRPGSVAGVDALQSLAIVAVALGALAVGLAPVYLWGATESGAAAEPRR
ncbi:hypothetical protein [Halobaculum litoreum]|uniref:hypothetical protein n=1 Tax=Halobaculum litoreum TaxID=3031998 RepID=UPI0024C31D1E|nr:hypothetical protein [Halobaculum sp. DT92]